MTDPSSPLDKWWFTLRDVSELRGRQEVRKYTGWDHDLKQNSWCSTFSSFCCKHRSFNSRHVNVLPFFPSSQCETRFSSAEAQDQPLQSWPEESQRHPDGDAEWEQLWAHADLLLLRPGQIRSLWSSHAVSGRLWWCLRLSVRDKV